MISLQIDRPGFTFVAIECATGNARYFVVTNNHLSIGNYCYHSSNGCYVMHLQIAAGAERELLQIKKYLNA